MKTYKINEIFYSLQGEGFFTGYPAIFIRFSGCNLKCPFCDTKHETGEFMTADSIITKVSEFPAQNVVLTGGEPSLFADEELILALHNAGKFVCIETNGTHELPIGVNWITLSPKDMFTDNAEVQITYADELKLVFDGRAPKSYDMVSVNHKYLQPCDTGDTEKNRRIVADCIEYIKAHPDWVLSLQTQKITSIQ